MSRTDQQIFSLRRLVWALTCSHLLVLASVSYLLASAIEPSWQAITLNIWLPALLGAGIGFWLAGARRSATSA